VYGGRWMMMDRSLSFAGIPLALLDKGEGHEDD